jgi:hypothetical protein
MTVTLLSGSYQDPGVVNKLVVARAVGSTSVGKDVIDQEKAVARLVSQIIKILACLRSYSSRTYMPGLFMTTVQAHNVLPSRRYIQHCLTNTTRHLRKNNVSVHHKKAMAHILYVCLSAAKMMYTLLRHPDVVSPDCLTTDQVVPPTQGSFTILLNATTWNARAREVTLNPQTWPDPCPAMSKIACLPHTTT